MRKHKVLTPQNIVIGVAALICISLIVLIFVYLGNALDYSSSKSTTGTYIFNGEEYVKTNSVNFLVFGVDKDETFEESKGVGNNKQADVIYVINLNIDTKETNVVAIDRDTMVYYYELGHFGSRLNTPAYGQVALAFTEGNGLEYSARNLKEAIQDYLCDDNGKPLRIDYYMGFTLTAVKELVKVFGGCDVTLDDDYTALDPSWTAGATIHLDEDNYELFVRSRSEDSIPTNAQRMKRQKLFIESFLESIKKNPNIEVSDIYNEKLAGNVFTNYSVTGLNRIMNYIKTYNFKRIYNIEGEHKIVDNLMQFIPDADSKLTITRDLFFEPKHVKEK